MNRNRQSQRRKTHERPVNSDTIRDMELESLALSNERNEFAEGALRIKTDAMMEVEAEWETYGKKSLSNQTKRNAAADDRLVINEAYTVIINDIRMLDATLKELTINISFEKREFTRATGHISDVSDIRTAIMMISNDVHAIALKIVNGY